MAEEDEKNVSTGGTEHRQPSAPVYTSYKTPDLNGGSKPPLVRVPGLLKPFSHTIPVDKISPARDEPSSTTEAVPAIKVEKPVMLKGQGLIPNLERIVEIETFVKDVSVEPEVTTQQLIDDEKLLKMTTTERFAEVIHPDFNNGEKLVVAEETTMHPSRNSTFVKVSRFLACC